MRWGLLTVLLASLLMTGGCKPSRDDRASYTVFVCPFENLMEKVGNQALLEPLRRALADDTCARASHLLDPRWKFRTDPRPGDRCAFVVVGNYALVTALDIVAHAKIVDSSGQCVWQDSWRENRFLSDRLVDAAAGKIAERLRVLARKPPPCVRDCSALGEFAAGTVQLDGGAAELAQARRLLAAAARKLPSDREALLRLGVARWRSGHFDQALLAWKGLLRTSLDPESAGLLFPVVQEAASVSWYSRQVLSIAHAAATALQNNPAAWEATALVARGCGERQNAYQAARMACRFSYPPMGPPEPWSGSRRFQLLASTCDNREREREALAAALLLFPGMHELQREAPALGLRWHDDPGLIRICRLSPLDEVRRISAHWRNGRRRGRGNVPEWYPDPDRAAKRHLSTLREDPYSREARVLLNRCFLDNHRYARAMSAWKALVAEQPRCAAYRAGLLDAALGWWDETRDPVQERTVLDAVHGLASCGSATPGMLLRAAESLVDRRIGMDLAENLLARLGAMGCRDIRAARLAAWLKVQSGAAAHDPKEAPRLYHQGLRELSRLAEAVSEGSALHRELLERLADAALRSGDPDLAESCAHRAHGIAFRGFVRMAQGRPTLSLLALSRTVAAFSGSGPRRRLQWSFPVGSNVTAVSVADIESDGSDEIVVGTGSDGGDHAVVYCLNGNGRLRWARKVGASGVYSFDDAMGCQLLRIVDLDGDHRNEIVATASHAPGCAGRLVVIKDHGTQSTLIGDFWNFGVIQDLDAALTPSGPRILLLAANNANRRAYHLNLLGLDPRRLGGQSPPYVGNRNAAPPGRELWCCPLAHVVGEPREASRIVGGRWAVTRFRGQAEAFDVHTGRAVSDVPLPIPPPRREMLLETPPKARPGNGEARPGPRRHALIVGTSVAPPGLNKLACTEQDCRIMAALAKERLGCTVDPANVLCGPAATRSEVRRRIEALGSVALQGDTVLLYWTGHGVSRQGRGCLITEPEPRSSDGYGMEELLSDCERWLAGCTVLLVLDVCYPAEELGPELVRIRRRITNPSSRCTFALWIGCSPGEQAREDPSLGASVFTYALSRAFEQHTGLLASADEVSYEVRNLVARYLDGSPWKQTPLLLGDLPGLLPPNCTVASR